MCALLFIGCQSTGGGATASKPERTPTSITFVSDADMLSALLRQAGPMIQRGGVVIMHGSGRVVIPAQEFQGLGASAFAERLATAGGLKIAVTPHYAFLYPEGYEVLGETHFPISGALGAVEGSASFGDGTRMYNALAILSQSLGVSMVADNIVAEIMCGEVAVRDAPLDAIVEALLRSARATSDAVVVEGSDTHVFLRAATNASPMDTLLNAAPLGAAQEALLAKAVTLALPEAARRPGAAVFVDEAMALGDVLDSLGKQLGVAVRAEEAMLSLPVNYTFLNEVSVRTALNLIVRQWPVAKFGFELDAGGVLLRAR